MLSNPSSPTQLRGTEELTRRKSCSGPTTAIVLTPESGNTVDSESSPLLSSTADLMSASSASASWSLLGAIEPSSRVELGAFRLQPSVSSADLKRYYHVNTRDA